MDTLESNVWDRACEVRYPFGSLIPPWEGDCMLSAMALADGFVSSGGVRELIEQCGGDLRIAADAYRYYGFDEFGDGLARVAGAGNDLGVRELKAAFRLFGLRWKRVGSIAEAAAIVDRHYAERITPTIAAAFSRHFRAHRELYGPVGHPSTWN